MIVLLFINVDVKVGRNDSPWAAAVAAFETDVLRPRKRALKTAGLQARPKNWLNV